MTLRQLLVITGIVVLLGVLAFFKFEAMQAARRLEKPPSVEILETVQDFDTALVKRLVVYKGRNPDLKMIATCKPDGMWKVDTSFGIDARIDAVENILKTLKGIKGELRAETKSLFADYEIEDENALHVVLEDARGRQVYHLLVSFLKEMWRTKNFVRVEGSEKTYMVREDVLGLFNASGKGGPIGAACIANFSLWSFDAQDIDRLELYGSKKITAVKSGTDKDKQPLWQLTPVRPKEEGPAGMRVDELLRRLSTMQGHDLADPAQDPHRFDTLAYRVVLHDAKKGATLEMWVSSVPAENNFLYAKVSNSPYIYLLPRISLEEVEDFIQGRHSRMR